VRLSAVTGRLLLESLRVRARSPRTLELQPSTSMANLTHNQQRDKAATGGHRGEASCGNELLGAKLTGPSIGAAEVEEKV
jgi:hypothetical protein